jgi:hypothetical protein
MWPDSSAALDLLAKEVVHNIYFHELDLTVSGVFGGTMFI